MHKYVDNRSSLNDDLNLTTSHNRYTVLQEFNKIFQHIKIVSTFNIIKTSKIIKPNTVIPDNIPHQHDFIQIWYVCSGEVDHIVEEIRYHQTAGTMIIVPPYTNHFIDTSNTTEHISYELDISDDFIRNLPEEDISDTLFCILYFQPVFNRVNAKDPIFKFKGEQAKQIEELLCDMNQYFRLDDEYVHPKIRAELAILLTHVVEQYRGQLTNSQSIMVNEYRNAMCEALRYIDEHYMEKLYVEDVCKIAMMSATRFSFVFKRIIGMTFVEYLLYLRILHARNLLINTDMTIFYVSKVCGFRNENYFRRAFTTRFGCSPTTYRKKHRNAEK